MALWQRWFADLSTWASWRVFLSALFGLPMTPGRRFTGRKAAPVGAFLEAWLVCGRRAGKSLILALVACFLAVFGDWRKYLSPGERATILVIAADRKQARVIFRYIRAFLTEVPALKRMITRETADTIELDNAVTIEIVTANFRTVRGYTVVAALCDEIAFWSTDEAGSNPDTEILAAIRPAMSTVPGAMLLCASSPHAKRGALWNAFRRFYGKDGAPIFVWRAPTRGMNETVPQSAEAEAMELDPARARAEYLAEFRDDIAAFVARELIDAAVDDGVVVRAPIESVTYKAFGDPSGGQHDSFTVGIGHAEGDRLILDCLYEKAAPFNPSAAMGEIVALLRSYRVSEITTDRWGAAWVSEAFRQEGIEHRVSERDRSAIYLDALALFTAGRASLLDNARLANQLATLERKVSAAGRDQVIPGPSHDDLANSACGCLVLLASVPKPFEAPIVCPYVADGPVFDRWSANWHGAAPGLQIGGIGDYIKDEWTGSLGWCAERARRGENS